MAMANDWILDVLSDLKAFASKNGLSKTAEQLDDATLIAAAEIASSRGGRPDSATNDERTARLVY